MSEIGKMFKDVLMGVDRETYDNGRVLCFFTHIVYYVMAFASYIIDRPWGAMDFATGAAAIAVGFGVHLNLKSGGEAKINNVGSN